MRNLGATPPRRATVSWSRREVKCGGDIATGLAVYAPLWSDATTPRTDEPARFFYHWERGVGLSHAGNVCAPWGRNLYIPR